ncbi:hypothetical protein CK203_034768 [Vitis vinifera]|uniref:Uncharacterized protein n=1 Tax=Vitis vinifera TaxID=29760 RepID=A0A438IBY3_VITVI|nr:hypothetical protein CK203_034768 [Vitis vinifera]
MKWLNLVSGDWISLVGKVRLEPLSPKRENRGLFLMIFLEVQLDGYWPAEFGMDSTGNELALGYTIGNPITDHFSDFNSRIAYSHQVGILSDELYEVIIPPTHSGLILNRI